MIKAKNLQYFLCFILIIAFIGCKKSDDTPIKIGFIGNLTGPASDVGVSCRNAVELAFEQFNQKGGISGHKVELIVRNNKYDHKVLKEELESLFALKVPIIIGPMFSGMALSAAETNKGSGTVCISPTAGTSLLSEIDDNFFRTYPANKIVASTFAKYLVENSSSKLSVIINEENSAFTEDWLKYFRESYLSGGSRILQEVKFQSSSDISYDNIAREVIGQNSDSILIIASALDTGMFVQRLSIDGTSAKLFATEWSMTPQLIRTGGKAVDGIKMFHAANYNSNSDKHIAFIKTYTSRFGEAPNFPALLAFDASLVALDAVVKSFKNEKPIKSILLNHEFEVLDSTLHFDAYGDVLRPLHLYEVRDGKFETVY